MLSNFYTYENDFKLLKLQKAWARGIDVLYRSGVAITLLYFGYLFYTDSYLLYDSFSFFYSIVAMTTVLTAGIITYHLCLCSILYIIYGNELRKKRNESRNKPSTPLIIITCVFFVTGLTWLYLGS